MEKERIILDTNTFINGAIGDFSYPSRIIEKCLEGKIQPLKSHPIERENKLIMRRMQLDSEYLDWIQQYFDMCEMIQVTTTVNDIPDDPEDEKFLEAAIDGQADYIITEDYHLLTLDPYRGINIVKPEEYWSHYEANDDSNDQWNEWAKSIGIGT